MRFTQPRNAAVQTSNRRDHSSKMDRGEFEAIISGNSRLATGANRQNEEATFKAVKEILKDRAASHAVSIPGVGSVKPEISAALYSHLRFPIAKSILGVTYLVDKKVYGYYLILDGTGKELDEYYVNGRSDGRNDEQVLATADMIMDKQAKGVISLNGMVQPLIHGDDVAGSYFPFAVVPSTCTHEDVQQLSAFVDNAIDCLDAMIRETSDAKQVTLEDYLTFASPRLSMDFTPDNTAMTAEGNPVRSDARAALRLDMTNNREDGRGGRQRSVRTINDTSKDIAHASVFADIKFFKDGIGYEGEKSFLPTIIVSDMSTGGIAPSISNIGLLLYTISQFTVDGRWANMLDPLTLQKQGKDINSIISDLPELLDGRGNPINLDEVDLNSQVEDAQDFMDLTFHDAPVVMLRIPRGAADTYAYQPLLEAVNDSGLNQMILEEIDALCNGRLIKKLKDMGFEDAYVFEECTDVVHVGSIIDTNGNQQSIDSVDYLTVATYSQDTANPDQIRDEWERTFEDEDDSGMTLGQRLNSRLAIIGDVVGGVGNVNVTGYADQIIINPVVLDAIEQVFYDAGFRPRSPEQGRVRARVRGNRHLAEIASRDFDRRDVRGRNTRGNRARTVRARR